MSKAKANQDVVPLSQVVPALPGTRESFEGDGPDKME